MYEQSVGEKQPECSDIDRSVTSNPSGPMRAVSPTRRTRGAPKARGRDGVPARQLLRRAPTASGSRKVALRIGLFLSEARLHLIKSEARSRQDAGAPCARERTRSERCKSSSGIRS